MLMQTQCDVRAAVTRLASAFNIPEPPVIFTKGLISRCQIRPCVTLLIAPRDWHGLHDATLHEFAHALRHHEQAREDAPRSAKRRGHDHAFYLVLVRVIRAWNGASGLVAYRWDREYKGVYALAWANGLTRAPHFTHAREATVKRTIAENGLHVGMQVFFSLSRFSARHGVVVSMRGRRRARVRTDRGDLLIPYGHLQPTLGRVAGRPDGPLRS